jgi:hypothetical protein
LPPPTPPLGWGQIDTAIPGAVPSLRREPALAITLNRLDTLVARSVAGGAMGRMDTGQGALVGSSLDLRSAPATALRIESNRQLRALASSREQDAGLDSRTSNGAVVASRILGGDAPGSYLIRATDRLDLALLAGRGSRIQVEDRVTALDASRLEDSAGGDPLTVSALLSLRLEGSSDAVRPTGLLALQVGAVRDSTIVLGDGNNRVRISSSLQPTLPPAPQDEAGDGLRLEGGAVALDHSLLDTGSGDDTVQVVAVVEPGGQMAGHLEALALDGSLVRLGDGSDRLEVRGAVRQSRIEAGSGEKDINLDGRIDTSSLVLSPGGRSRVWLGDAGASLQLLGSGDLALTAGAGADQIRTGPAIRGWIDGGAGDDGLIYGADGLASGLVPAKDNVALELDGSGQGVLGDLRFTGIENLELAPRGMAVRVGPQGSLAGALKAPAGAADLDYGSWSEGVNIDLREGRGTGFALGQAGGVQGVERVWGGAGNDHLVAAAGSHWLDGAAGDDWLELASWGWDGEPAAPATAPLLTGGEGQDLFVLPSFEALVAGLGGADGALAGSGLARGSLARPTLVDLSFGPAAATDRVDGAPLLSDRLAYWRPSYGDPGGSLQELVELLPSGLEGIGDPRLLPIAPLEQLLAGMGDNGPQLAIATGAAASELVLLGPGRSSFDLASLPALRAGGGNDSAQVQSAIAL